MRAGVSELPLRRSSDFRASSGRFWMRSHRGDSGMNITRIPRKKGIAYSEASGMWYESFVNRSFEKLSVIAPSRLPVFTQIPKKETMMPRK